jgi:hypothetical protein
VALAAATTAGCLVSIDHCTDPVAAFREARAEAQRVTGRPGKAKQVNVLVFDPDEEELIRVSVPLWLARKAYDVAEGEDVASEWGADEGTEARAARHLRRRVRFADLEKAGPGVLVEVEGDDGEQVLVWLR